MSHGVKSNNLFRTALTLQIQFSFPLLQTYCQPYKTEHSNFTTKGLILITIVPWGIFEFFIVLNQSKTTVLAIFDSEAKNPAPCCSTR